MKKIIIGIIVLVIVVAMAVTVLFMSLSKEKLAITAMDFASIMEQNGYVIQDVTGLFEQYDNYITKGYVAGNENFQIEFYELSNDENAIYMYNTNKQKFENQNTSGYASSKVEISNYGKYTLKTNGKFKCISRIDNTLVYIDVNETYEDTVKELLNKIGY